MWGRQVCLDKAVPRIQIQTQTQTQTQIRIQEREDDGQEGCREGEGVSYILPSLPSYLTYQIIFLS